MKKDHSIKDMLVDKNNPLETFHQRFQSLLQNTSFIGFSRKSGISDKSIRDYFYGRTVPNIQKVKEIADLLECNPSWLAFGIGAKDKTLAYPIADNPAGLFASEPNREEAIDLYTSSNSHKDLLFISDAGLKQHLLALKETHQNLTLFTDNLNRLFTNKKITMPFNKRFILEELKCDPSQLFTYQVLSDSMTPTIKIRDIILVNVTQNYTIEGIYLLLMNGSLVLRHVQQMIGNKLKLSCMNALYSDEIIDNNLLDNELFLLGKVIWVGNKLV